MDYTGLLKTAKHFYKGLGGVAGGAARGAGVGAGMGAFSSLLSGGNIISGGLGGAFWGAGLGAGSAFGAGKIGYRSTGTSSQDIMGMMGASTNKPFMTRGFGISGGSSNVTPGKRHYGASFGGGGRNARVGVGVMGGNAGVYASARLSTLAGVAGGYIGRSRGSKNHAQIMSNSMPAGSGSYY